MKPSVDKKVSTTDRSKIAAYIFGVTVIFFVLCVATPLGSLGVIEPSPTMSRGMSAYPLVATSVIAMAVAFIAYITLGIIDAVKQKTSKAPYIVFAVIVSVLCLNPIGLFILYFVVACNFQPCVGI